MPTAKKVAREIFDRLPDRATQDGVMCELYVKEKIEQGSADIDGAIDADPREPGFGL